MTYLSRGLAALAVAAVWISPAFSQDALAPLMHGALVYHGNYCGPGNKGHHPRPVDALDEACMHHDACVKDFQLPACSCNARLKEEAALVARDPQAPAEEREAADFTARGADSLPCQP